MKNDTNKQLEIGKKIEREHSDTIKKIIADVKAGKVKPFEEYFKDIAKDHLKELKDYYTRLVKMEKEGEKENINESIKLDIEKGDTILTGKFRNKKVVVKTIGTDEHGSPTVNGKSILNVRIEKLMKSNKKDIKESDNIVRTLLRENLNQFAINVKDREAGMLNLRPIPQLGKDAVEIINIKIDTKDFKGIKVAIDAVHSIFKQSKDINKIVIAPKEESKDFWNHVGFNRLNNDYMFIMRGH